MKESFYQELERTYDAALNNDIKIVMGDINAKIGKEQHYMGIIEKHSLHEDTNENEEFLVNFAASKKHDHKLYIFPTSRYS